jgi:hypothetical protein
MHSLAQRRSGPTRPEAVRWPCVDGGGEISRARNPAGGAANGIRGTGVVRPRRHIGSGKGNFSVQAELA